MSRLQKFALLPEFRSHGFVQIPQLYTDQWLCCQASQVGDAFSWVTLMWDAKNASVAAVAAVSATLRLIIAPMVKTTCIIELADSDVSRGWADVYSDAQVAAWRGRLSNWLSRESESMFRSLHDELLVDAQVKYIVALTRSCVSEAADILADVRIEDRDRLWQRLPTYFNRLTQSYDDYEAELLASARVVLSRDRIDSEIQFASIALLTEMVVGNQIGRAHFIVESARRSIGRETG